MRRLISALATCTLLPSYVAGAQSVGQRGTAVHGLLIPYPATWVRQSDPSGAVTLVPPQMAGVQQYVLFVVAPSRLAGTHWESHKALAKTLTGQVQWSAAPVMVHYPDAPGPFIRTSIAGKIATGATQQVELYTAAHDGMMEAVVGTNGIDRNVVEPVLQATTFATPPRQAELPRIVEAYRRIDQKIYNDIQRGTMTAGSLMYERIWLRADGLADFSTNYPEGYAASPVPAKVDPGLVAGDYGRWKAVGDQVQIIRRDGAPPEIFRRAAGGIERNGALWQAMPRVDGLRLRGRFSRRSPPEQRPGWYEWIEFGAEGRFTTDGLLRALAFGDVRPKPPEKGTGTYELRDWTIFFRFDSGERWSTDFSTLGPHAGDIPAVIFRTTVVPREK